MFYLSQFCCVHYYFCIDVSNMYICMAFPIKPTKQWGMKKKWRSDHSLKTTLKKMKKWKKKMENEKKWKEWKNEKWNKKKLGKFCFFGFFWFFSKITSKAPHFDLPGAPFWPSLALALVWPCSSFWPPWGSLLAFRSLAMPASRTQNGKHRSKSGRTSLEPLGLGIVCG